MKIKPILKTGGCSACYTTQGSLSISFTYKFTDNECYEILSCQDLHEVSATTFKKYYLEAARQEAVAQYGFEIGRLLGFKSSINLAKIYVNSAIKHGANVFYKARINNDIYYISRPWQIELGKKYKQYWFVKSSTI